MGGETHHTIASSATYPQLAIRPVGKQISHIYKERLNQFRDGGQYREQGLIGKLYNGRVSDADHITLQVWSAPGQSRPTFAEATKKENDYRPTGKGESFGPSWSTHWFRLEFQIPKDWSSKDHFELHWDSNSEAMIWSEDGKPLQGLTGGGERVEWIVPATMKASGKWYTIYVEMACNAMFGNPPGGDVIQPPADNRYFPLSSADLVIVNLDARQLYYDYWIISDAAKEFSDDGWEQHQALQICTQIMETFFAEQGSASVIRKCREIAREYIGNVDSDKVYDNDKDKDAIVYGIGNCHIDTCWLWPWDETKRKVARSWSSQCNLLDTYPEYRFTASQAQQFKWLQSLYPYAWDRVKQHVKKGNFLPIGGSWVEHDTNMPSGESLIRQFLYGQRFFESRFGQRCRTFWLPDTFGYSSQLPQICRLAGMTRFFTQKLSWNNINNFPHTTFNWVSLDGSQVICHMAPCETYTAEAHFGDVKRSVSQHKSLDQDSTSLLPYGKGDGGGGPTFEMIEKLRRCRGLADTTGLLPRVKMGVTAEDFFDRLEAKVANGQTELVTWYGELYFELHRGTYTTQANNKRNNRKSEVLLHDLEYLATLASITNDSYTYPKSTIDEMWENVLLCQFHDCLPGSSIEMCYDDSNKLYAHVFEQGQKALDGALKALGFNDAVEDEQRPVVVETLGWDRALPNFAPRSAAPPSERGCTVCESSDDIFELSNEDFQVKIESGLITSIYDVKARREVIPKGQSANQFVIFDDKPLYWQAWDVEVYHLQSRRELKPRTKSYISRNEATKVSLTTSIEISAKSWITTTVSLCKDSSFAKSSLIEIEADVEWRETMKFLKVEFPTTVTNSEASYETQFGIVRRPTHYNTSWDMAKFEVCCHKWADLSEHGYGVSILNESKYGFATVGNVMRLSLLRAPKAPDAHADMGHHHIKWAILPHSGPLDERTVRAGYQFNHPLRVHGHARPNDIKNLMTAFKLSSGSSPSLVVDTIKRGEDDEDASNGDLPKHKGRHVIVRVYDSLGGLSRGVLQPGPIKIGKVWKCNVLEDHLEELKVGKNGVEIEVRAFEVATFKFELV